MQNAVLLKPQASIPGISQPNWKHLCLFVQRTDLLNMIRLPTSWSISMAKSDIDTGGIFVVLPI